MSYRNVVQILSDAKKAVDDALIDQADATHHRLKITADLQRNIEYINLLTGSGDISPETKINPGPATTIGGQPIKRPASRPTPEDLEPPQRAVAELRDRVEAAYTDFLTRDSKEILKEVDDTTIRGVAKKAKMQGITKDYPEKITLQFIEEIKDAIMMDDAHRLAMAEQKEMEAKQPRKAVDIDEELADTDNKLTTDDFIEGEPEDETKSTAKTSAPNKKKGNK